MTEPITSGLWPAVDLLTNDTRHRLVRDDKTVEWVTVPSLWVQLCEAVEHGRGSGERSKPGSRPPVATEALALLMEIEWAVALGCRDHGLTYDPKTPPITRVPQDMRRLASEIVRKAQPIRIHDAVKQLDQYGHRIRQTLGGGEHPTIRMRGVRCTECGARTAPSTNSDGEACRIPAIAVTFAEDGSIRAAECEVCGAAFWRGDDLLRLAAQQTANLDTPDAGAA